MTGIINVLDLRNDRYDCVLYDLCQVIDGPVHVKTYIVFKTKTA